VLATAAVAWRVMARWPRLGAARTAALYSIGSVAAYWSWLRIAAILA
jgi:hypothetical protein